MSDFKSYLICIGDSIVEGEGDDAKLGGWVGRIASKLPFNHGDYRTYNLGIAGNTITEVWHRVDEVYIRDPDIVILGYDIIAGKIYDKLNELNYI